MSRIQQYQLCLIQYQHYRWYLYHIREIYASHFPEHNAQAVEQKEADSSPEALNLNKEGKQATTEEGKILTKTLYPNLSPRANHQKFRETSLRVLTQIVARTHDKRRYSTLDNKDSIEDRETDKPAQTPTQPSQTELIHAEKAGNAEDNSVSAKENSNNQYKSGISMFKPSQESSNKDFSFMQNT